jgi:hypothetical protein
MKPVYWMMAVAALLSACGEKPQTLGGASKDESAFKGTGMAYVDSGWKQGDQASWESHLKARGQNSQNEYNKTH